MTNNVEHIPCLYMPSKMFSCVISLRIACLFFSWVLRGSPFLWFLSSISVLSNRGGGSAPWTCTLWIYVDSSSPADLWATLTLFFHFLKGDRCSQLSGSLGPYPACRVPEFQQPISLHLISAHFHPSQQCFCFSGWSMSCMSLISPAKVCTVRPWPCFRSYYLNKLRIFQIIKFWFIFA